MKRLMLPFYFLAILLVISSSGCNPDIAAGTGTSDTGSTETTTYSVTYYSNTADSGAAPVDSTEYEEGASVTVSGNTGSLVKSHYTFAGWNTAADGFGTTYTAGSTFTMGTADVSLYAVWTEIPQTISYNANGGSGSMADSTVREYSDVTLPINTFTKPNYNFAGWSTTADGAVEYTDGAVLSITDADVELYAVWVEIKTISYNANSGNGSMNDSSVSINSDITLPVNTFTKPHYSFAGWSTSSGGAVEYTDGAVFSMGNADIILYAVWQLDIKAVYAEVVKDGGANSCLYGVAADDNGNIYAAGYQNGKNQFNYNGATAASNISANNSVIIKYDENGNGIWARVVNDGGAASTFKRVAVDAEGNIYAAGFQTGTDTYVYGQSSGGADVTAKADNSGTNAVIVKYTSAGNVEWAKTVIGGENKSYFNAVAVDKYGNVYAAGYQAGAGTFDYDNGVTVSASNDVNNYNHCVLVKYDSDGNTQWAKSETGKNSKTAFNGVTTDINGDVYVAGYQWVTSDYTTVSYGGVLIDSHGADRLASIAIKYSSSGVPQWGKIAYGTGSSAFYSIVTDDDCNVYTSGYQYDESEFNYGDWVTVKSTSRSCYNGTIVKYDSTGKTLWAKIPRVGSNSDSSFYDIAMSADNYIYISSMQESTDTFTYSTGITAKANYSGKNSVIVRYNTDGKAEWVRTVNYGSGNSNFKSVFATNDGSILVAGYQDDTGTFYYGSNVSATSNTGANNSVIVKYY